MSDVGDSTQQDIDATVDGLLAGVTGSAHRGSPQLARAVLAERLSAVAHHRSRDEVAAACAAGVSWEEVGRAFGMSPENARQHFGRAPSGLPE